MAEQLETDRAVQGEWTLSPCLAIHDKPGMHAPGEDKFCMAVHTEGNL